MEDTLRRLGQRIRELRLERGFKSQEEFADYCKIHRTFLGHLETGRKDFRLTTIIRIAEALGVTMSELFKGLETGERVRSNYGAARASSNRFGVMKELATLERSIVRLKRLTMGEDLGRASAKQAPGSSTRRK